MVLPDMAVSNFEDGAELALVIGKRATFAPNGQFLIAADEIKDPQNRRLSFG
jgi:hypothetical protein